MKKVLAGILIAALTMQISAGAVFAGEIAGDPQAQTETASGEVQTEEPEQTQEAEQTPEADAQQEKSEQETPKTGLPRIAIPVPKGQESTGSTEIIRGEPTEEPTGGESEASETEYPDWYDPNDPMSEKLYEQMNDPGIRTMSSKGVAPNGQTTYWPVWDNSESTFIHNPENLAGRNLLTGIDVSYYDGSINWTKVKNNGVEFAIIRAGYRGSEKGTLCQDSKFTEYMQGARAAGMKIGVYFFTQARTTAEAVEEANYVLKLVSGYGHLDLPIFFDYEAYGRVKAGYLSRQQKTDIAKTFCQTIKNAGYDAMVYSDASWFKNELDIDQLAPYGIWMARYNSYLQGGSGDTVNPYTKPVDLWQCTSSAKVDGIGARVDLDFWYTDKTSSTFSALRTSPVVWQGTRSTSMVRADWNWIKGVSGYEVAYSAKRKSGFKTVTVNGESATNRQLTGLADGREYYVKVRSFVRDAQGRVSYSPYSSLVSMTTSQSVGIRFKTTANVHVRQYAGTEYSSYGTVAKGKSLLVQAIASDESGAAWYKVSATVGGKSRTGYIKKTNTSEYVGTVSGVGKSGSETTAITVKWSKLPEAQGYQIYRATSKNGTYKKVKTAGAGTTSWRDTGKSSGKTYYYKIRAYKKIGSKTVYGSFSSKTGLATAKAKASTASTGKKIKTTANVNLRKKAGTSYAVLKTVPKGKTFTVLGTSKDKKGKTWYKIKYTSGKKSYTGYISSQYAKATSSSSSSSSKSSASSTVSKGKKVKTTANVNLRKSAGTSYKVLKTVPKGKKFTVLGTAKDKKKVVWYKIKYTSGKKSYTGYISSKYAKKA